MSDGIDLLHGHRKLIFWDQSDDGTIYLERQTVKENEAVQMMADDMGCGTDEIGVEPIWMRWVEKDIDGVLDSDYDNLELPCWAVCSELAVGSIPFWRVAQPKVGGGSAT